MNAETLNLIERPFAEVVDDILTALVGGVVNEPILFDLRSDAYPLAQTAQDVRGITGTRQGTRHTFQKGVDFLFSPGDNSVVWQEGGLLPDDDTIFYADYFRPQGLSPSPLSDINVGSVTRTISEAIGREIATVYLQINRAYLQAFVDSAEGKSLDLVVAILGLRRQSGDFASGLVTFFRDPSVKGNVTIAEGTLLSTEKGESVFRVSQARVLQQGQVRVDVPIRAVEDFPGEAGLVPASAISELSQPLASIARVTNFEPTFLGAEEESDEELRARAKTVVRASGKATLAALAKAIFEARGELLEAFDPNSPPLK
ncbi:MAG: baseplate J/gp47 family protein, partial [Acidobacteriota bacterium]